MSLRTRVVALIGLVLIAGVLMGSILAGYEARRTLQAELHAGMTGGEQTVRGAFEDLPRSDHAEFDLRQLIATFNGNRHVRAVLSDGGGKALMASDRMAPYRTTPAWFTRLFGDPPAAIRIAAPPPVRDRQVVLQPISDIDVSALWGEFYVIALSLGASAIVGLVLVFVAIGTALRPLSTLSAGFVRIGSGDYQVRVRTGGPSELFDLQRGFNAMADRLAAISTHNRALEAQLATIQDEERADLARDLHDEIGPHLFAVNVDAEVLGQLASAGKVSQVGDYVRSIQGSVGHMQRLVREILGRLRPSRATELGLNPAIEDLAAFWRGRAGDIDIRCDLLADEAILDEAIKDNVYRVIQESLNNAVRHSAASHIEIKVSRLEADQVEIRVKDDGLAHTAPGAGGLGIVGMGERVKACGGVLTIDKGRAGGGWTVIATLPLHAPAPIAEREVAR